MTDRRRRDLRDRVDRLEQASGGRMRVRVRGLNLLSEPTPDEPLCSGCERDDCLDCLDLLGDDAEGGR
ncbi:hypothetical protein [Natrinema sp. 1APR25-10V2]|uniref:hypothetical protein n=1 Tax=Natrinema sp. 1APR25-10V2 TaxID=2951081 RepID=UPI0028771703|nr:hypothetical protein [Natrinema sp. 1APR25-10V2]MDS0477917.1 hypothetical protein [Natrinema sp. 1APR25-10V2]